MVKQHRKGIGWYAVLASILVVVLLLWVSYSMQGAASRASECQKTATKTFEGLHRVLPDGMIAAYPDPAHGWRVATIGYGTTRGVYRGMIISDADADRMFDMDAARVERYVYMRVGRELTQCQFDALFDHAYNVGSIYGNLYKNVVAGNDRLAAMWLSRYVYAGGRKLRGLVIRANYRAKRYLECDQ